MLRVADGFFSKTDRGRQRRSNEDAVFARPPLFAVADGMGGARAGEVASGTVVELLEAGLPEAGNPELRLADGAREANRRIHEMAETSPSQAGMGTTLTAAYVGEDAVSIAHVGDSRAYRLREGELERITDDHSLVGELVRRGKLTEAEAEDHPQRSVITRALGPEATVDVDTWTFPAQAGDVFLLCSDGLTSMVDEGGVADVLRGSGDLRRAGQALIDEANRRGGRDNITVVLFRLEEVGAPGRADETEQPTEVGLETVATAPAASEPASEPEGPPEAIAPAAEEPPPHEIRWRTRQPRRRPHMPRPHVPRPQARPARRSRRGLRIGLIVLALVACLFAGGWFATRSVYFVGTDDSGFVAVYRGLPYDGPLGVPLYERVYVSGIPAAEIPPARRAAILDHQLRSRDDARDLVRKLELGQVHP